jgi:hypothetical protein
LFKGKAGQIWIIKFFHHHYSSNPDTIDSADLADWQALQKKAEIVCWIAGKSNQED